MNNGVKRILEGFKKENAYKKERENRMLDTKSNNSQTKKIKLLKKY